LAAINKRVFNRWELRRGAYPVLIHVGRSSGRTYRVPLDAHRVGDGFVFILMYGSGSEWVRNVQAAGSARLEADGEEFDLVSPRLMVGDDARPLLPEGAKPPPDLLNVTEYLRMDIRTRSSD
jgi:deazaflavin-dependent oxidoreductase (nitroreductase family)